MTTKISRPNIAPTGVQAGTYTNASITVNSSGQITSASSGLLAQGVQGVQGGTGLAFTIAKVYASVAALTADTSPSNILSGQFAIVDTGNVGDADNSKLYLWNGSSYQYINDLSGTAGIQGISGYIGQDGVQGIQGIQGIQGVQGIEGIGVQGTAGISIQGIQGIQGPSGSGGGGGGTGLQHTTYTYTANGSTTTFEATSGITVHTVLVILDGITQMPTTDYTVSGSNVVFTSAPPASSVIQIRVLGDIASSGGGPKISNIAIVDSNWDAIDDTAVDITGGYIKITGTGFVSGCLAYFNQTAAASISFVSSTELRISTGSLAASTYVLYVINPDGGVAISVPGVTFSATPGWQTASSLSDQYDGIAITLSLVAQDATSYTLVSGSLPPGLSLNTGTGTITGTVTGVTVDTTYTFTVRATDAQLQDSPRTFTVTITVSDPYFNRTTLLLSGSALSANTVIRDSSTNNFNLTVAGDARASNFSPYGTGWSNYFDGNGDYLSLANNAAFDMGSGDFTIDCWFYLTSDTSPDNDGLRYATIFSSGPSTAVNSTDYSITVVGNTTTTGTGIGFGGRNSGTLYNLTYTATITKNIWHYVCVVRSGSTLTLYYDGTQVAQNTSFTSNVNTGGNQIRIGALAWFPSGQNYAYYFPGYISALKVVKGVANTPSGVPSTPPTQSTGTSLLTCQSNRFIDASANNFAITGNGDAKIVSFNPFGITNTGVNGSAYFDGSGDYLTVPQNTAFAFGTGDFTVEFWVNVSTYRTTAGGFYDCFLALGNYVDSPYFRILSSGIAEVGLVANSLSGTTVFKVNTWYHYAVSRSGTTARLFINGVLESTITNSSNLANGTAVYIGTSQWNVANETMTGLLSNLRIVKGTAVYTSNFTPPTAPLTAITNTQLLTLQYDQPHNNHTFLDSSSNQFLITRNGNATQGTFSPFSPNGWSNYFVANNANTVTAATAAGVAFGTGDFCQEFFLYATSYTGTWRIISYASVSGTASLLISSGAVLGADTGVGGLNTGITLPTNTWFHLAYTRQSGRVRIFVNGVLQYNFADTTNYSTSQSVYIGGYPGYTQSWDGYISNARIIKGSVPAAYQTSSTTNGTSVFTPPTGPLTAVTGTELLTCQSNRFVDNNTQTTAKTITLTSSPQVQAFSPFAPTAVYNPAIHGGSAYFDGNGDYLTTPDNVAFTVGSGNWTLEAWVYPTASPNQPIIFGQWSGGGDGSVAMMLSNDGNRYLRGLVYSGGYVDRVSGSSLQLNAWNHCAFVREGTFLNLYLNGSRVDNYSFGSGSVQDSSLVVSAGAASNGTQPFQGYICDCRFLKGTAQYTGATYTVPAAPVTANTNTQLLLNFTDAAILDSTGRTVIETAGDAKSSSVITKFTGGSMYFDGTGDSLITPASIVNSIGTGDFTIEFWCYPSNTAVAYRAIVASENYNSTAGGWSIYQNGTGIEIYLTGGALVTAASQLVASTWQHIALVRSGSASNNCKLYVNGTNVASATNTADWTGQRVFIGDNNYTGTDYFFNGYIQDLRITKGYARYTVNFTAPTAPHRLK